MYPKTDSYLNRSSCSGGLDGLVSDAYWGPQLASMSAYSLLGEREELRKVEISFYCCVVNVIPRDLQPLRYFTK